MCDYEFQNLYEKEIEVIWFHKVSNFNYKLYIGIY